MNDQIRAIFRAVVGPVIILITLIAMLAMTWRTWPEPIIDFGRELYVPWQLSQGKVLYRDIAYFNGPLSPYFNSIIFRILGVSMMSLVAANIAIFIGILAMMYWLALKMSDRVTATIACCAFVLLLGVGQPGAVGNYNYITPYSHEMTHGLALSLAAMCALVKFDQTHKRAWILTCGTLVGLVWLTKPEIVLSSSFAMLGGVFLVTRGSPRRWLDRALFIACVFAVVLLAIGVLSIRLPAQQSIHGIFGTWRWVVDSRITSNPFYQRVRGTFDLGETFYYLGAMAIGYGLLFGVPGVIGRLLEGNRSDRRVQLATSFVLALVVLFTARAFVKWEEVGRGIISIVFPGVGISIRDLKSDLSGSKSRFTSADLLRLVFSIFASLMLAKTALRVQFYHYGFVLAAPALVMSIVVLFHRIPKWIERKGGTGAPLRGAVLAAVAMTCGTYVYYESLNARQKTVMVGSGADAFYVPPRQDNVNTITDRVRQTPADATVAIVPQGAMINYLARRQSSTPYVVQMPPEVIMYSQQRILDSFVAHPPDYVLLLDCDTSEYGFEGGYARDFGLPMFEWIAANYRPVGGDPRDPNLKWILYGH